MKQNIPISLEVQWLVRYLGEGPELTHDETELLLFQMYCLLVNQNHPFIVAALKEIRKKNENPSHPFIVAALKEIRKKNENPKKKANKNPKKKLLKFLKMI